MANKKISELVAATVPLVGDESFELVQDGVNKKIPLSSLARIKLTADTTYYVATTGNDSTGDGSVGNPWLTIQKAIAWVASNIDGGSWAITIQVAAGTYASCILRPLLGSGAYTLNGDTITPANVIISASAGACVVGSSTPWVVRGFTFVNSAGNGVQTSAGASLTLGNNTFGACSGRHMAVYEGKINVSDNYTITGNSYAHWLVQGASSSITCNQRTITISGTPAFTIFAEASTLGAMILWNNTFSGSATGKRYQGVLNAVINAFGAGTSYLPGNAAGTVATGAQYA